MRHSVHTYIHIYVINDGTIRGEDISAYTYIYAASGFTDKKMKMKKKYSAIGQR